MQPSDLAITAADFLDLHSYKDYGPMGLQYNSWSKIKGIAAAVSVTEDVIHRAGEFGANALVVHHGLFWNTEPRTLDSRMQKRLAALKKYNMSLFAYHLALDAHPIIGNNVLALKGLGATNLRRLGDVGWGGDLNPRESGTLYRRIVNHFNCDSTQYFDYGPWPIRSMAVVTGGGGNFIHQAAREGYDLFLTGEPEEPSKALARELGMHFIAAGHYATEKDGVDKLAEFLAASAKVPYRFIVDANPV